MKFLTALIFFLFSVNAFAQFSEQEVDGNNKLKVLGREFDINFFSLASVEPDKAQNEGGRLSTYNYVTFSSYVGLDYKAVVRVPFTYGTAGTDRFNGGRSQDAELALQDIIIGLRNPELAHLPWDLGLYWEGRVYLPTSEFSQKSGMIARLNNKMIFTKVINRHVEFSYTNEVAYYHQSRTVYPVKFKDEYGFDVETSGATKRFSFGHDLDFWYKHTPDFGVGWSLGIEDEFYNKSEAERKYRRPNRMISTGPQMRFPLNDNVNFILIYSDKVDRLDNRQELGRFLAKNTEVILLSFVRF